MGDLKRYIFIINDLSEQELTLFFYYFILKIPIKQIAKSRGIPVKKVSATITILKKEISTMPLKKHIYEAFCVDML